MKFIVSKATKYEMLFGEFIVRNVEKKGQYGTKYKSVVKMMQTR